jgi:hypothetical protein
MAHSVLEGFLTQDDFAASVGAHPRTIQRYRDRPDGLPSVEFLGKIWIPVEDARAWLMRRIRRPNPTGRAA